MWKIEVKIEGYIVLRCSMGDVVMVKKDLIQFVIYLAVLVFGLGMSWATYGAKIGQLEQSAIVYSKDHDALIALDTKMDVLLRAMSEVQKDLKEHLK